MHLNIISFLSLIAQISMIRSATITLDVFYPETEVTPSSEGIVFVYGYSTSPYTYALYESHQNYPTPFVPWFGNNTYLITQAQKFDQSHWQTTIDIGNQVGEIYVMLMSYAWPNMTLMRMEAAVKACAPVISSIDFDSWCYPRHSPYTVKVPSISSAVSLAIHPSFDSLGATYPAQTYTMFKNLYSPQLGNRRNIATFVPTSILENSISRPVQVLIVLDGHLDQLKYLVKQGIDSAVVTGDIPEIVLIGVPPAVNGTVCPNNANGTASCWQRGYEYTPTPCDLALATCLGTAPDKSGGGSVFLTFVNETVIPAVMKQLGMLIGEVSIAGYSLGGMMSCYAASSYPQLFQRALCMSPSVWWNRNDMAPLIRSNGKILGKPKSVVIEVGSIENGYMNYLYTNPNSIPPILWGEQIGEMTNAFESIGMGLTTNTDSSGLHLLTESTLYYYIHQSGRHSLISWGDIFSHSVTLMYRYDFPDKTRSQLNSNLDYLYPVQQTTFSSSSDKKLSSGEVAYAVVFPIFTFALGMGIMYVYFTKNLSYQSSASDKSVPMSRSV